MALGDAVVISHATNRTGNIVNDTGCATPASKRRVHQVRGYSPIRQDLDTKRSCFHRLYNDNGASFALMERFWTYRSSPRHVPRRALCNRRTEYRRDPY